MWFPAKEGCRRRCPSWKRVELLSLAAVVVAAAIFVKLVGPSAARESLRCPGSGMRINQLASATSPVPDTPLVDRTPPRASCQAVHAGQLHGAVPSTVGQYGRISSKHEPGGQGPRGQLKMWEGPRGPKPEATFARNSVAGFGLKTLQVWAKHRYHKHLLTQTEPKCAARSRPLRDLGVARRSPRRSPTPTAAARRRLAPQPPQPHAPCRRFPLRRPPPILARRHPAAHPHKNPAPSLVFHCKAARKSTVGASCGPRADNLAGAPRTSTRKAETRLTTAQGQGQLWSKTTLRADARIAHTQRHRHKA